MDASKPYSRKTPMKMPTLSMSMAIKYAKDPKRKIKIEVACDKIVELRLRQAAKGQLQMSGASLVRTQMDTARDKQSQGFQPPKWTRGLIVTPVPKEQAIGGHRAAC